MPLPAFPASVEAGRCIRAAKGAEVAVAVKPLRLTEQVLRSVHQIQHDRLPLARQLIYRICHRLRGGETEPGEIDRIQKETGLKIRRIQRSRRTDDNG